jgi:hypothetical protein
MIPRLAVTGVLGAAVAATVLAGVGTVPAPGSPVTLAAMSTPLPADGPGDRGHGPGWDGRHGSWDGRGGPGRGGGWDGVGGGWDGHRWWVAPQRCRDGHGHVSWGRLGPYCQGGLFNGVPVHP